MWIEQFIYRKSKRGLGVWLQSNPYQVSEQ
jgi:hypothetical protein